MKTKSNEIICDFEETPFQMSLSFHLLIEKIEEISRDKQNPYFLNANDVLKKVKQLPELSNVITDVSLLENHADLIKQLMSFVINPLNENIDISAVFSHFDRKPIHTSVLYDEHIGNSAFSIDYAIHLAPNQDLVFMVFQAYLTILKKYYNFDFESNVPFTYKVTNNLTGAINYYTKKFDITYLDVIAKKELKPLSKDEIFELFDRAKDLSFWNERIPLSDFEFSGFVTSNYINVTHDHVMSELKSDLMDKNSILQKQGFDKVIERVRVLIDNPNMKFGIAVRPNFQGGKYHNDFWRNTILKNGVDMDILKESTYETARDTEQIVIIKDYLPIKDEHKLNAAFVNKGIRSHAVIPLFLDDDMVGMMEFACEKPNAINMFQIMRLHDVFPIFALALKRSREELNDRIQSLIQKNFTAIHPTVDWKFREVASQLLTQNNSDVQAINEPIVFNQVIPIYGASDIRSSSVERNKAIKLDLQEQLKMAKNILVEFNQYKSIPFVNDLMYKINENSKLVQTGLNSGDEVSIVEFMKNEITPVFNIIKSRVQQIEEPINKYFNQLDPELGILYKKRKAFEDSLTLINNKVSEIIDQEQVNAQEVFPHYFEKYRTDGIEYNGYIGQSLVHDMEYSDLYLRNIRLWQLLVKVKVARKIQSLQPELPIKLNITQLILIHSNPLSIEFRQDEKKFDVAGTYNIRYEITKKRIDKARIKGSKERVTQVGKIAIVYSHSNEILEYQKFIDYMISEGYITSNIEYLELEDLKGASGLHAIRLEVNFACEKETEVQKSLSCVVNL
ncbi:GAF domain-containing protein [Labilibacter marinus]|uniref:GAF domain-containing protein n=1 Tax=Labilibacter marinus TaxID=1477105 RepID=UPI00082A276A|nr:GAF domain-containing protein [Labilibacter marinus]